MDFLASPILAAGGQYGPPITDGFLSWAAWLVLFAPLAVAFAVTCIPAIRKNVNVAAGLAVASVGFGLVITLIYFFTSLNNPGAVWEFIVPWVTTDGVVQIAFGTRMDALAITMGLVVNGVGL